VDYSVLTGGTGSQPLQPAQRFCQIKQLGITAAGSRPARRSLFQPVIHSFAALFAVLFIQLARAQEKPPTDNGAPVPESI